MVCDTFKGDRPHTNEKRIAKMESLELAQRILMNLPYEPNDQQLQVIAALARFCLPPDRQERVFLLNGYAGTGKTSLTGALVKTLTELHIPAILMAPTGRAAKVFGAYANHPAYTIHRRIYRHPGLGDSSTTVGIVENKYSNAVFIIDEASMIGGGDERGNSLLEDLIHYVYSGDNCRLILLGDTAQLPPVGCPFSPAMNVNVLKTFGLKVTRVTLTETVRQKARSGILYNATWLRRAMQMEQLPMPRLFTEKFSDVKVVPGEDLAEMLDTAYNRDGINETILITRSNKRASDFNLAIRGNILYRETELTAGELLLVSKNNYYWSSKVKGLDFIANGDVVEVVKVFGMEAKYGYYFADVMLAMPDRDVEFEAKIFMETLSNDTPGLTAERTAELYTRLMKELNGDLKALKQNPYFNALQMKYAYAVTCHKAQGGQWQNVFVDMSYISPDAYGMEFYRWLYTAVSRARSNLYFINPGMEAE